MRIIAEIPHSQFKISIFSWKSKYIIKIELGNFEQVFKLREDEVSGLEDIKKLITDSFLEKSLKNFIEMRSAFSESFSKL